MKKKHVICAGVLFAFALIGLIIGLAILILLPGIVKKRVEDEISLKEGSPTEVTWLEPPHKISLQFWIFNITNADDVLNKAAKPILSQKGPYGYREKQKKENVSFVTREVVSYANRITYFFEPALSCETCKENDTFTIPNIPYVTVLRLIRNRAPFIKPFINEIIKFLKLLGEGPFVTNVRADDLLFNGYEDKIFNFINKLKPGALPARMGLFFGKNSTTGGIYEINTGVSDAYTIGRVLKWENHSDLYWTKWWRQNFSEANMINGTDGTLYPPFIQRTDMPRMFIRDICRSMYVTYKADTTYKGLKTYRFTTPYEVFSSNISVNRGFCWPSQERYYSEHIQPREPDGWCLPSGMLDISKCQYDVPIVITWPQFVFCPEEVKQSVIGLYPSDDQFVTFLDIEPTTGAALTGARKVQLNVAMYVDPSNANYYSNMKSVIMPIVWLNESVVIDESTYKYIYDSVVLQQRAIYIGAYVSIGLGCLLLVALIAFIEYARERQGRCCPILSYGRVYASDRTPIIPEAEVQEPSET